MRFCGLVFTTFFSFTPPNSPVKQRWLFSCYQWGYEAQGGLTLGKTVNLKIGSYAFVPFYLFPTPLSPTFRSSSFLMPSWSRWGFLWNLKIWSLTISEKKVDRKIRCFNLISWLAWFYCQRSVCVCTRVCLKQVLFSLLPSFLSSVFFTPPPPLFSSVFRNVCLLPCNSNDNLAWYNIIGSYILSGRNCRYCSPVFCGKVGGQPDLSPL